MSIADIVYTLAYEYGPQTIYELVPNVVELASKLINISTPLHHLLLPHQNDIGLFTSFDLDNLRNYSGFIAEVKKDKLIVGSRRSTIKSLVVRTMLGESRMFSSRISHSKEALSFDRGSYSLEDLSTSLYLPLSNHTRDSLPSWDYPLNLTSLTLSKDPSLILPPLFTYIKLLTLVYASSSKVEPQVNEKASKTSKISYLNMFPEQIKILICQECKDELKRKKKQKKKIDKENRKENYMQKEYKKGKKSKNVNEKDKNKEKTDKKIKNKIQKENNKNEEITEINKKNKKIKNNEDYGSKEKKVKKKDKIKKKIKDNKLNSENEKQDKNEVSEKVERVKDSKINEHKKKGKTNETSDKNLKKKNKEKNKRDNTKTDINKDNKKTKKDEEKEGKIENGKNDLIEETKGTEAEEDDNNKQFQVNFYFPRIIKGMECGSKDLTLLMLLGQVYCLKGNINKEE